ncbi:pilus biosynthesis protein PilZ [Geoanaerobacter pelophilus]|uniref:Pilus biosynthesis protein PilZ n=1 Tax=Geoanaerobacter pelophilus TaxID=60036 RepID=A0ABQ0MIX8_9BACT|nr:pilus biosynthesis protein PilZ [Geoanaerobacter pelophilus]
MLVRGDCHKGCMENVSLNGALLHLDDLSPLAVGEACVLQLQVDEAPLPPLRIDCEVVHGCECLVGVKFLGSAEEAERRLPSLIKLMSDPRQGGDEYLERIRGYLADFCGAR